MIYVTIKETQVSGNADKTIPEGIAVDVVQENDNTLTLANGDWINTSDAMPYTESTEVNASGNVKLVIENENDKTMMLLSSIGFLAGLYYAFTKKKSFWGYVGFGLLGSVVGSVSGSIIKSVKK
jgi:hypothetical protein